MEKRLDCKQINEVCLVIDRFIEPPERHIEISHPDCSETFCQGSDVLPPSELMQSRYTSFGLR
jgi:hypothetical protein